MAFSILMDMGNYHHYQFQDIFITPERSPTPPQHGNSPFASLQQLLSDSMDLPFLDSCRQRPKPPSHRTRRNVQLPQQLWPSSFTPPPSHL